VVTTKAPASAVQEFPTHKNEILTRLTMLERAVQAKDWAAAANLEATVKADLNPLLGSSIGGSAEVSNIRARYEKASTAILNQHVEPPQTSSAPPNSNASAERAAAAQKLIPGLVKTGFIKRINLERGNFYMDGPLWEQIELNEKENLVKIASWYREAEYRGLPQVTLYDSRSGKELGNYGVFSGVTIR